MRLYHRYLVHKNSSPTKKGFLKTSCARIRIFNCQCPKTRVAENFVVYFLGYSLLPAEKKPGNADKHCISGFSFFLGKVQVHHKVHQNTYSIQNHIERSNPSADVAKITENIVGGSALRFFRAVRLRLQAVLIRSPSRKILRQDY